MTTATLVYIITIILNRISCKLCSDRFHTFIDNKVCNRLLNAGLTDQSFMRHAAEVTISCHLCMTNISL